MAVTLLEGLMGRSLDLHPLLLPRTSVIILSNRRRAWQLPQLLLCNSDSQTVRGPSIDHRSCNPCCLDRSFPRLCLPLRSLTIMQTKICVHPLCIRKE